MIAERSSAWHLSDRADPRARTLADRHYNRQSPDSPQFVPPGRCLVLLTAGASAFWITSWPYAEYVKHAWAGAWICSAFRNEGAVLSSDLIHDAVAATRAHWPEVPDLGMVTFVNDTKVRRKRDPGRCFRRAGFEHVGFTKGGLWAFQLLEADMPPAKPCHGEQGALFLAPPPPGERERLAKPVAHLLTDREATRARKAGRGR